MLEFIFYAFRCVSFGLFGITLLALYDITVEKFFVEKRHHFYNVFLLIFVFFFVFAIVTDITFFIKINSKVEVAINILGILLDACAFIVIVISFYRLLHYFNNSHINSSQTHALSNEVNKISIAKNDIVPTDVLIKTNDNLPIEENKSEETNAYIKKLDILLNSLESNNNQNNPNFTNNLLPEEEIIPEPIDESVDINDSANIDLNFVKNNNEEEMGNKKVWLESIKDIKKAPIVKQKINDYEQQIQNNDNVVKLNDIVDIEQPKEKIESFVEEKPIVEQIAPNYENHFENNEHHYEETTTVYEYHQPKKEESVEFVKEEETNNGEFVIPKPPTLVVPSKLSHFSNNIENQPKKEKKVVHATKKEIKIITNVLKNELLKKPKNNENKPVKPPKNEELHSKIISSIISQAKKDKRNYAEKQKKINNTPPPVQSKQPKNSKPVIVIPPVYIPEKIPEIVAKKQQKVAEKDSNPTLVKKVVVSRKIIHSSTNNHKNNTLSSLPLKNTKVNQIAKKSSK